MAFEACEGGELFDQITRVKFEYVISVVFLLDNQNLIFENVT